MGTLPATGQEIAIGKIARAFGLEASYPPSAGSNIRLNNTLGMQRGTISSSDVSNITASSTTEESADFGGLDTPEDYPT